MSSRRQLPPHTTQHVGRNRTSSLWELLLRRRLPLERETSLFILASALDVIITYLLLTRGGFRESNPIAEWFWHGWGLHGIVSYKFGMVTLVVLVAQVIARHRIEIARRLLTFGTVIVVCVVAYSSLLLYGVELP